MEPDPQNAKQGRRGHHLRHTKRPPSRYTADYQNPFGGAAKALQIDSDKRLAAMLGNRVAPTTVRDWRRGRYKAPAWALEALRGELERQRAFLVTAERWLTQPQKEKASS